MFRAKYGFVTFEKPQDAYKAIDCSSKDPVLSEYDVSFGGRRAFCRTEYADLGMYDALFSVHILQSLN